MGGGEIAHSQCPSLERATARKSASITFTTKLESTCGFARCRKYDTSFEPAVAVKELLRGPNSCLVQFLGALHQAEAPTKLAVKRFGVVAHHFEPAAFRKAFSSKCADNHVATAFNSAGNLLNVDKASLCCCKKMEYRSLMPEIVGLRFQLDFKDI